MLLVCSFKLSHQKTSFSQFYIVCDTQHIKKGRANDICGRQPCINGGTCLQTSLSPGYKCKCEGMLIECVCCK